MLARRFSSGNNCEPLAAELIGHIDAGVRGNANADHLLYRRRVKILDRLAGVAARNQHIHPDIQTPA